MVDGVTMKAGWEEHYGGAGVTLVDWRRSPCKMSHFNGSKLQPKRDQPCLEEV
ncbi:hypothetical protein Scep_001303 [Stephania cephalantha]|uniref:Uncharacterized protein n=1 Tax=Stephania cephalantha TaxID=152367 RepID=A0AAP0L957_9MAGN